MRNDFTLHILIFIDGVVSVKLDLKIIYLNLSQNSISDQFLPFLKDGGVFLKSFMRFLLKKVRVGCVGGLLCADVPNVGNLIYIIAIMQKHSRANIRQPHKVQLVDQKNRFMLPPEGLKRDQSKSIVTRANTKMHKSPRVEAKNKSVSFASQSTTIFATEPSEMVFNPYSKSEEETKAEKWDRS